MYRSTTAPYFAPPSAGAQVADLAPGIHTYTDSTADLAQAGSYYYVVASMSASDALVGASNRTGAFAFGLTPGGGPWTASREPGLRRSALPLAASTNMTLTRTIQHASPAPGGQDVPVSPRL